MRNTLIRAGVALSVVLAVGVSDRMALSDVTETKPACVPDRTEPSREVESPALLVQTSDPKATTWCSPVLMVWRDRATGELKSRTLPADPKAVITIELAGSSRNVPATMPMQENSPMADSAK